MPFGGGGASKEAELARQEEEARQARIREGTDKINTTFGQFNDDFFDGIRTSFIDFARPQLDDQYNDAREDLTFALARSGTLDSSMRGEQSADLQKKYDLNLQDITDQARSYETEARTDVEKARGDLVTMLQATGDATGAANAALSRAAILAKPPSYSPIGQLFQDAASAFSTQAALEKSWALGLGPKPKYTTGLYGTPSDSVKTT